MLVNNSVSKKTRVKKLGTVTYYYLLTFKKLKKLGTVTYYYLLTFELPTNSTQTAFFYNGKISRVIF